MRIEEVNEISLKKASPKELQVLRLRFTQLWDKNFAKSEDAVVGSLNRDDFLSKYALLRDAFKSNKMDFNVASVDKSLFKKSMTIAKLGIDFSGRKEIPVIEGIISIPSNFSKSMPLKFTAKNLEGAFTIHELLNAAIQDEIKKQIAFEKGYEFAIAKDGIKESFIALYDLCLCPRRKIEITSIKKTEQEKSEVQYLELVKHLQGDSILLLNKDQDLLNVKLSSLYRVHKFSNQNEIEKSSYDNLLAFQSKDISCIDVEQSLPSITKRVLFIFPQNQEELIEKSLSNSENVYEIRSLNDDSCILILKRDTLWGDISKPYPNEHAARLIDPKVFEGANGIIRRVNDKFGPGISAIFGKKSAADKMQLQTIRFDSSKFTVTETKKWLKEHDYAPILFEPASEVKKFEKNFVLFEKAADQHIVCGVVYEPDVTDAQGDAASADEIEKAAHRFMEDVQIFKVNHKGKEVKVKVLENYIAPIDFNIEKQSIKKGSWLLTLRILDDKIWENIKKGELTGYSMAGYARA